MAERTIFRNAAVFDGKTPQLLHGQSVVVEDGKIVEVREGDASVDSERTIDVGGRTLMPGMIDLHTHAAMMDVVPAIAVNMPPEMFTLHAVSTLKALLSSGFTTIRDAGGLDAVFPYAMERGLIEGPRLFNAGRCLSITGGHGDVRNPLRPANEELGCCGLPGHRFVHIVDGADEVRKAVREELRRGARHIKMFMSGGVMSAGGNLDALQFTEAEISAAVDETAAQGTYVMAHCHPDAAIRRAAELGVRSVEHCSFVTESTALLMARKGTYAVPTLAIGAALEEEGDRFGIGEARKEKLRDARARMADAVTILARAGVKIGFGSDVSGQLQSRQGMEFTLRAALLPSYDVLISATSIAAELLGEQGRLGIVAPGALADLIVVEGDPLEDVRILAEGSKVIPFVMKEGAIFRCAI